MTQEELNQQYTNACARLGDLLYKQEEVLPNEVSKVKQLIKNLVIEGENLSAQAKQATAPIPVDAFRRKKKRNR